MKFYYEQLMNEFFAVAIRIEIANPADIVEQLWSSILLLRSKTLFLSMEYDKQNEQTKTKRIHHHELRQYFLIFFRYFFLRNLKNSNVIYSLD